MREYIDFLEYQENQQNFIFLLKTLNRTDDS